MTINKLKVQSEVYLRFDLERILNALAMTARLDGDERRREGYMAALCAVATAVGVEVQPAEPERLSWTVDADRVALLGVTHGR